MTDIGPHLSCLALNNEILLSKDNRILTFQGHPELDAVLSQLFLELSGSSGSSRPDVAGMKAIDAPHDGEKIFEIVMRWASGEIAP